jgi:repressor LexA
LSLVRSFGSAPDRVDVPQRRHARLTVSGDSMIDAAICDGEAVAARHQDGADHGDIVGALLEYEAIVVLRWQDGRVWLMPRNPAYQPIPGDQDQILGKGAGVLRTL